MALYLLQELGGSGGIFSVFLPARCDSDFLVVYICACMSPIVIYAYLCRHAQFSGLQAALAVCAAEWQTATRHLVSLSIMINEELSRTRGCYAWFCLSFFFPL